MDTTIVATIITGLITLVGIFASAKSTRDKVTIELSKQNALQNQEIEHIKAEITEMKADIKEHNNYARMFAETMPVVKEQIKYNAQRLESLEQRLN